MKLYIKGLIALSLVSTALAAAPKKQTPCSIYCCSFCVSSCRVPYKIDPTGTVTDPCENGNAPEYVLKPDGRCSFASLGATYSACPPSAK